MSAARNQCSSPLNAFNITSWSRIARSHAAPAYAIEPPSSLSYRDTAAIESGQITCSRERPDHVLPTKGGLHLELGGTSCYSRLARFIAPLTARGRLARGCAVIIHDG